MIESSSVKGTGLSFSCCIEKAGSERLMLLDWSDMDGLGLVVFFTEKESLVTGIAVLGGQPTGYPSLLFSSLLLRVYAFSVLDS